MGKRPKYPWDRIFKQLEDGIDRKAICEEHGMSMPVLRNKIRTEANKAKQGVLVALPTPPRMTPKERARQAKFDRADARIQAAQTSTRHAIDASGVDRSRLEKVIRLAIRNLEVSTENRNAADAVQWSRMLTMTAEKLGHVLQSEEQLKPPDHQPSADTPEGQVQIATMLNQNRGLLATLLAAVDADVFAWAVAEAKTKREA